MVTPESRNNIVTIVAIIAIAILITAFIYIFSSSLIQVAQHGENTVNVIGKSVAGNVSKSADINRLNLLQFNRSMTDVITSNDNIVKSNNASIANLSSLVKNFSAANTKYLASLDTTIAKNKLTFNDLLKEQKRASDYLVIISKQLSMLVGNITTPSNQSTISHK